MNDLSIEPDCRGPKLKLPDGKSLIDLMRSIKHVNTRVSSKEAGLSREVYELSRRLVVLKDRQVLTEDEEKIVDRAFVILEEDRQYVKAARLVDGILKRLWKNGTRNGEYKDRAQARPRQKIQDRFDRVIFTIGEVCTNLEEVQIPVILSRPDREKCFNILIDSISELSNLMVRVRKGTDNE